MDDLKNSEVTLSHFAGEVLFKGPEAVLPQNLPGPWLRVIQKMADDFLDVNFESRRCGKATDVCDPIVAACVYEIRKHREGEGVKLSKRAFIRYATIYCISVTMETVRRESGDLADFPTLDNIFSEERIRKLRDANPDLGDFFKRVCLDETDKNK